MKFDWLLKCKCLQFFRAKKKEEGIAEKAYYFEQLTPIDIIYRKDKLYDIHEKEGE